MESDKKIEDYLHLYLGCPVKALDGGTVKYALCGIDRDGSPLFKTGGFSMYLSDWKLILRPLSDMSEEEEFEWSENGHKEADPMMAEAEATRYLLSKHFDLFNLIPEGLAIDKTKI